MQNANISGLFLQNSDFGCFSADDSLSVSCIVACNGMKKQWLRIICLRR